MKTINTVLTASAFAVASAIPAIASADFQSEIAYYSDYTEYDDKTELGFGEFSYRYYLDKVSAQDGPLAEAGYLQRVSDFAVGLYGYVVEYPDNDELEGGGLALVYNHRQKDSPLNFGVLYDSSSAEYTDGNVKAYESDLTRVGFNVGWFIDQTTTVNLEHIKTEIDYSAVFKDSDKSQTSLTAKTVRLLGGGTAVNLEAYIGKIDYDSNSNSIMGVLAEYYLDSKISIGVSYEDESGDEKDDEGTTTGFRGQVFFNEQFSAAIVFESYDSSNNANSSYDSTAIRVAYRF